MLFESESMQEGIQKLPAAYYLPELLSGRNGFRNPEGTRKVSLLQNVQTGPGAHSLDTGGGLLFPGSKSGCDKISFLRYE